MVQDFGENRKAAYSDEVKSAHFAKQQITVHPIVCFSRHGGRVVRRSYVFMSDDIEHDHHAVQVFTQDTDRAPKVNEDNKKTDHLE
ncbi:Cc8L18.2-like protein [Elysia marginata]|uniref:Cc8L18.2-like protein n=1 Tax=Elysia marginata TaxID=1093978 RepID=A0AAV4G1H1_9GAST|nr:Cc8L18.2-like protein [Elysia marginata]